jgi:Protein involved in catabolism of external DNA
MNYDHRFHAGNFGDVLKHVVLTRILIYLQRKPTPFRVIDTHAGAGTYDLTDAAADRTGEWRSGIGRLDPGRLTGDARGLIAPYLDAVGGAATGVAPYPGSPALALRFTRPFDRMIFCELHPATLGALRRYVGRDRRAKVIEIDGYTGLNAFIPPIERRGLILIDPPFEAPDEFERMAKAIVDARAKWRDGIIMAWYPIKDRRGVEHIAARLVQSGISDVLRLELALDPSGVPGRLAATGLFVVNPPYTLEQEMACLLPEIRRLLAAGSVADRGDRPAGRS